MLAIIEQQEQSLIPQKRYQAADRVIGGRGEFERRGENEVLSFAGVRVAPEGARADNPAFDVTPARLVAAIFTERGEASPPSERTLVELER